MFSLQNFIYFLGIEQENIITKWNSHGHEGSGKVLLDSLNSYPITGHCFDQIIPVACGLLFLSPPASNSLPSYSSFVPTPFHFTCLYSLSTCKY